MQVTSETTGTTYCVSLSDRLSFADHGMFRKLLEDYAALEAKTFVLELSGLKSIDSAGLGMFMIALDVARKKGGALTLRGAQGHVKSLLLLGRFDKLLKIE